MESSRKKMVLPDSYAVSSCVFYFLTAVFYLILFSLAIYELIIKMKPFDLLSPLSQIPAFMFFSMSLIAAFISIYLFYALYSEDIDKIRVGIIMNSVVLGLTFVLTVIAFVIVFGESHSKKEAMMYTAIHKYHVDKKLAASLDLLQSELKCCGIKNYVDWNKSRKYTCLTNTPVILKCSVPKSCCRSENGLLPNHWCGSRVLPFTRVAPKLRHHNNSEAENATAERIYTNGCSQEVKKRLREAGIKLLIDYVVLLFLEVLSLVFHICSQKYLVKRNRCVETCSSVFYRELSSTHRELPSTRRAPPSSCRPKAKPFRKLEPILIPVERDVPRKGITSNYINTLPCGSPVEPYESWRINPCQNINPFEKSASPSNSKRVKYNPAIAVSFDNTIYTLNGCNDPAPKVDFKTKAPEAHNSPVSSFDNAMYNLSWFSVGKTRKAHLKAKASKPYCKATTPEKKSKAKTAEVRDKDKKSELKRSANRVDEVEMGEAGPSWKLTKAEAQIYCAYGL